MSIQPPATTSSDLTISYDEPLSLDPHTVTADTISPFTRRPRKIAKGESVRVLINNQIHLLTVASVHSGRIVTSDWRHWWTDHPDRTWGDPIQPTSNYLIG